MVIPIVIIVVCVLSGGGMFLYLKLSKQKSAAKEADPAAVTANEFVNVRDVQGKFLYTRDGFVLAYLRIMPVSIDLFSKSEKKQIVRRLTANMSAIQYPFQLLAVSRPVDISPLLSELSNILNGSEDVKQKELLRQEMVEMSAYAISGDVVERQFYIKLWDKENDGAERGLLQKLKYLEGYLEDVGIHTEILSQQEIVRLCNLVNNPCYVHLEDADSTPFIPVLEGYGL